MSTLTVTDIRRTGETASRSTRGVAASWLNLNGTGTIAVRDSQNVSSVTDNGTGDYRASLTATGANSNFAIVVGGAGFSSTSVGRQTGQKSDQTTGPINRTTSQFEILQGVTSNGTLADHAEVTAATFGSLA